MARASTPIQRWSTATAPSRPAGWKRLRVRSLLRDSRFDPVADLPVRELLSIQLAERSSIQRGEIHGTVPGEWIRPYVHQRYDDMSPVGGK